jgi:uncharacterized membrane protein SirB2
VRSVVGTVLELAGVAVIFVAAFAVNVWLAAALGGVVLVVAGYLIADPRRTKPKG